jgi:ribosome-associated protein
MPAFSIPEHELDYRVSRSGGPGGQHVNTSSTRVEVWWDVARSPSLAEDQRSRLLHKLASRLDAEGRLRLVSSASRSQLQNRRDVTERLHRVVNTALVVPKARRKTKPSRRAKERRLAQKKAHSKKKAERRRPPDD